MDLRNKKSHLCMVILLFLWTFDAVVVAKSLEYANPAFIIFLKSVVSLPLLAIITKISKEPLAFPDLKDVPLIFLTSFLGDIAYYYLEYKSYEYLPLGMVTVCFGMCPLCSYLVDCIVQKRKPSTNILTLIIISIAGLGIAVLTDDLDIDPIGYLYCALAIAVWIMFGYAIKPLGAKYETVRLTFYLLLFSIIMMLPFIYFLHPEEPLTTKTMIMIAIAGIVMNGFGYLLEAIGMINLGTTICGLYVNMLPMFTATAGFLFLGDSLSARQIIGSLIVIACGFAVIILIGKEDAARQLAMEALDSSDEVETAEQCK